MDWNLLLIAGLLASLIVSPALDRRVLSEVATRCYSEYWRYRALHERAQASRWRARCLAAEQFIAEMTRGAS